MGLTPLLPVEVARDRQLRGREPRLRRLRAGRLPALWLLLVPLVLGFGLCWLW